MDLETNLVIDDGVNEFGVHRQIILEGDQAVTKLTYDAQPFLERAHAQRVATAGDRWGEGSGTKVGEMPMAVFAEMVKIQGVEERQKFARMWLLSNPGFVTFEKFLK